MKTRRGEQRMGVSTLRERGQVTLLAAMVLVLVAALAVGIAIAGRVAVDRARAHGAADSVALAGGVSPVQEELVSRALDDNAIEVSVRADGAFATAGLAQARSWASEGGAEITISPALIAIVHRMEQILGREFTVLSWQSDGLIVSAADGVIIAQVASEFGLCRDHSDLSVTRFARTC